ncbi:hypothetical protein Ctob_006861 [Chrysochromulina tobinii]|uniref:Uncharacterized protein n=1 Tax=Chrysochromulina tobinii TaxID=1460289 RepID=A0A0M0JXL5_9EUKA|nr:hypothetical protein Ctob_006861 [Chrysochromulina tobinii]|eukprot:KOO31309.1 hypothetical protein Ctob_006861 [Chrysochromulina sp. CCMP291]
MPRRRSSPSREHLPCHRVQCRSRDHHTCRPLGWPSRWRPTPPRASRTRLDGARRRHVHHEHVGLPAACEGRRAERCLAVEIARHESTPRARVRDAVAAVERRAARLDGPVDGARCRHVHHERVVIPAAYKGRRAERCLAAEVARHESTSRAIVCNAEAAVIRRAARLDGPVDGARCRHVHHERVVTASAYEERRAE